MTNTATIKLPSYLDPNSVQHSLERALNSSIKTKVFSGHFTIGYEPLAIGDCWSTTKIFDIMYLSRHRETNICSFKSESCEAVLIGDVFLPNDPKLENKDILEKVISSQIVLDEILDNTDKLFGRWLILLKISDEVLCFGDGWNSFAIFFGKCQNDNFWVASSPKLIGYPGTQEVDNGFVKNFLPLTLKDRAGGQYPGDRTPYYGIRSLLPNHCLNITAKSTKRIWPRNPLKKNPLELTAESAAADLKGLMTAIGNRREISVGVTGGTDSRLILAALSSSQSNYFSYTGVMKDWCASENHFDVSISKELTKIINAPHKVVRPSFDLRDEVLDLFNACCYKWHPIAWRRSAFYMNWEYCETFHLVGWGSEINRRFWDIPDRDSPYLTDFLGCLGYRNNRDVAEILLPWINEARNIRRDYGFREFDLFYWEMRLGRWAAESLSDLNLGQRTLSPFSSREWFERILGATGSKRQKSQEIYARMTELLEPRFRDIPINPFRLRYKLRRFRRSLKAQILRIVLKSVGMYDYRKRAQSEKVLRQR